MGALTLNFTDSVSLVDAFGSANDPALSLQQFSDTLTLKDNLSFLLVGPTYLLLVSSECLALSDLPQLTQVGPTSRGLQDNLVLSDFPKLLAATRVSKSDQLSFSDTVSVVSGAETLSFSDTLSILDGVEIFLTGNLTEQIDDSFSLSDGIVTSTTDLISAYIRRYLNDVV